MTLKTKLHGIMSLSAASMAVLGLNSAKSNPSEVANLGGASAGISEKNLLKTSDLLLAPPDKEKMLQLYAGHASHASHASHYSGAGDGDVVPSMPYVAPGGPSDPSSSTPPPAPVQTWTRATNFSQINTSPTNSAQSTTSTNEEYVLSLKERSAKGSATAQCLLGLVYSDGTHGVATNLAKAELMFELSALQGDEVAKQRLEELRTKKQEPSKDQK